MESTQKNQVQDPEVSQNAPDQANQGATQPKDDIADFESKQEELRKLENEVEESKEDQEDADERSVFVKNVDYSAEPAELKDHFKECGEVKRVTIPVDKASQQPKGHAFIEFTTIEAAQKAKRLTDSLFKGRQITVIPKRKNIPGRGRAIRGGGKNPMMQLVGMLQMVMNRGGRGARGRGFRPY
eukprot:403375247